MAKVPFYSAGAIGLIKDVAAEEIDPRAWSDCRNFRFDDGKARRAPDAAQVFGTPSGNPYWLMPIQAGSIALWVYADLTKLYATDGATHADVSRTVGGAYAMNANDLWDGGILSGIPVITNGVDKPQFFAAPALANDFADLTNWPVNDRCGVIRPFKSFLVAMNITRSGTNYPHIVKWSHPASPGAIPSSWDEADPTKLTGEVELVDEFPGVIKDALALRDIMVIYKDNTVWGMQFIGGNSIFRFFPIFINSGIMSKHCVCAIDQGAAHFVLTGEDVIVHDGQNSRSVLDKKTRRFIFDTIPPAKSRNCFVCALPDRSEAWAFITTANDTYPSLAVVYNWRDDLCYIKSLGANTSFAAVGPIAASSDPWDADSGTWDSDTTTWDEALFSAHFQKMVSERPLETKIMAQEDPNTFTGSAGVVYLERQGIAVTGQDRVSGALKADNDAMKLVSRIWVKATGGAFNVQLGGAEYKGAALNYQTAQVFTPGTTKYLDFYPVHARFLAIKFSNIGSADTEFVIEGFDLEIEVLGDQ